MQAQGPESGAGERDPAATPAERPPAWLLFVAGWLLASAALRTSARSEGGEELWPLAELPPGPPLVRELLAGPRPVELERAPPRVLRRLPGIGARRAVDLARLRWERSPDAPLELEEVRGIGPKTEARVRAWLEDPEAPR